MTTLSRRSLFSAFALAWAGVLKNSQARQFAQGAANLVGVIRWDAWYNRQTPTGHKVEDALSPPEFHYRAPLFSRVNPTNTLTINGTATDLADEARLSRRAGLSYWAFDSYPVDNVTNQSSFAGMSDALNMYLRQELHKDVKFCLLAQTPMWGQHDFILPILERDVKLMAHDGYVTVLDGRPLYFLGFISEDDINHRWLGIDNLKKVVDNVCAKVIASTSKRPYLVLMDFSPRRAAELAKLLGCDAISAYAAPGNVPFNGRYEDLAHQTEAYWNTQFATGLEIVPIVMTGWDRRPRLKMHDRATQSRSTQGDWKYYNPGSANDIADHLKHCMDWMSTHRSATPSRCAIIYAWNENDEGGWLIPTLGYGNTRLEAIGKVLNPQ